MPIVEASSAMASSFATIVSLASAFSTGRDVNQNTSLIEFQNWLVDNGHKDLSEDIANSHATSIYIKALLNQQLPLIIEAINELKDQSFNLPINIQSLLNLQSDVLLQAIELLERKIQSATKTQVHQQSSSGDRAPNVAHHGSGNISVSTGDTIHTQINHYGISISDHKKALEERERGVREELSKTSASDQLYRELLEKEYSAIREKLSNLEQDYQEELASRAEAEKTLQEIKDKLPQFQTDAALKKFNEGDKAAARALFDQVIEQAETTNALAGKAAYENGQMAEQEIRYLEANEYYQKAVRFQPDNSTFNNALGSILHDLGQYDKAIEYYQLALASDLKTYRDDHPDVARDRHNLGTAYHSLGQYTKAIEYYQLALASDLKAYGEDHPKVVAIRNHLGLTYRSLGQYTKAIEYYQLALASDLKTYGEDHPGVAAIRTNLGTAYHSLGQYDKAIEYSQLALASDLKTYGEDHPKVAAIRVNLGMAYHSLGQYTKAIEYYQLALASDLKTYRDGHPGVARDRNNLGLAYLSLGQYDKAIEYFRLALVSDLKTYSDDHPDVAIDRNNLGLAYLSLGQYDKAIEYFQLALKTCESMLGKEHPNTKLVADNLRLAHRLSE